MKDNIDFKDYFFKNFFKSYPTKFLPNLSQTLTVVPLPIKGSNTNSNDLDV